MAEDIFLISLLYVEIGFIALIGFMFAGIVVAGIKIIDWICKILDWIIQKVRKMKKMYICNPDKNHGCKKTSCYLNGGPCISTTEPKAAKRNSDGTPRKLTYLEQEFAVAAWIRNNHITEEQLEELKAEALENKMREENDES